MIKCETVLQGSIDVKLNDGLVATLIDKHQKALEMYPDVPHGSSDGIISYDIFSDGRITAKFSGYSIHKDKVTEKLFVVWERTVVGHN
jgi:hypothetical protein